MENWIASLRVPLLSVHYSKFYDHTNLITPCSRQVRAWNEFEIPVPFLPYVPSNSRTMASFVRITHGKVHGGCKRRDDYTASKRAGTMHCCIAVSFDVLPSQRVSFDVLPTQRVYPWYCISDGFVLPRDNQSPTDTRWFLMCDQHRFIILEMSFLIDTMDHTRGGTRQLRRSNNELVTLSPPMLNILTTTYDDDDERGGFDNRSERRRQRRRIGRWRQA